MSCTSSQTVKDDVREKIELCASQLNDKNPYIRTNAIEELGYIGEPAKKYAKNIAKLLEDKDAVIRSCAVSALCNLDAKKYAKDILKCLSDDDRYVRISAIGALEAIDGKGYANEIKKLISDKNPDVRVKAMESLEKIGGLEFEEDISKLLDDSERAGEWKDLEYFTGQTVRSIATETLVRLKIARIDKSSEDNKSLLTHKSPYVRKLAIRELKSIGRITASEIAELLNDKEVDVRAQAIKSLAELNAADYISSIAKLLGDDSLAITDNDVLTKVPIRSLAIGALSSFNARGYEDKIAAYLNDSNSQNRKAALSALHSFEAKKYIKDIAKLLSDDDRYICKEAIEIIVEWGAKEFKTDLLKLLSDVDNNIRDAAIEALQSFEEGLAETELKKVKEVEKGLKLSDSDKQEFGVIANRLNDKTKKFWLDDAIRVVPWEETFFFGNFDSRTSAKARYAMKAFVKSDEMAICKLGGVKQAKDLIPRLLESDKGFSAIALAVLGEKKYTKDIANLLYADEEIVLPENPDSPPMAIDGPSALTAYRASSGGDRDIKGYLCRRAIIALGLLEAKEYAKDVAKFLQDKRANTRSYAALGLAYMGAKEYAKDITQLLKDRKTCLSAIEALVILNAREFAGDLVKVLKENISKIPFLSSDRYYGCDYNACHDIIYALADLDAKEYSKDIAKLLKIEDIKTDLGIDAAIALGMLGAKEYAKDIANMLEEQHPYAQMMARLALGMMEAKEYVNKIAEYFKVDKDNPEAYIVSYDIYSLGFMKANKYTKEIAQYLKSEDESLKNSAALALGILGAKEYAKEVIPILENIMKEEWPIFMPATNWEHVNYFKKRTKEALKNLKGN